MKKVVKKIKTIMTEKKKELAIEKTSTDRYSIEYSNKENDYRAEIIFRNGQFEQCDYTGVSEPRDLEDWHFLGLLSKEVGRLAKKYKNK